LPSYIFLEYKNKGKNKDFRSARSARLVVCSSLRKGLFDKDGWIFRSGGGHGYNTTPSAMTTLLTVFAVSNLLIWIAIAEILIYLNASILNSSVVRSFKDK
jgi:hypothetical protein